MMNKNEAVQKLATVGRLSIAHAEDLYDSIIPKPVVLQCIADWYEVEKETKYRVKLKGNSEDPDYLVNTGANGLRFYNNIFTQNREFTRKELEEANFGWVFGCEGIEIKEVE